MILERPSVRASLGFTLLEVLIATAVFAIVLAAMNTVFFAAMRLRNTTTNAIEESLPVQQAMAIVERDLSNLVLPGGTMSGSFQTTTITNGLPGQWSPYFYTTTGFIDDTSPWSELQRVSYGLVISTNRNATGRDLIRATTRNLLPVLTEDPPTQQWLMSDVQDLRFFYYDGSQWRDSWDSTVVDLTTGRTNTLPQAIKLQIQRSRQPTARGAALVGPIELIVPVVVQARTNQTQQAGGGSS